MKKQIVFIMSYPWFSLYQRPNHFARQFKQHGYAVDVVEMRHMVRLNSLLNRMKFDEHRRDIDNLWSVVKFPFLRLENIQLSRKIRHILASKERGTEFVFWFQGFDDVVDYERLLPLLPGLKILDVSDSFPDFFTDPGQRRKLEQAEKTVPTKVDVVLATAEVLYEKFKTYNPRTFLIKNAVDLARYRTITPPSDPTLTKKLESVRPAKVIGYQGGIAVWFDFVLMEEVIRKNPELFFLFAGMVDVRVRREFNRLSRNRNFLYVGAVGPDILPWVLSKIDVGIIPFKINDLIRAVNPIKLYEYLAAGKPVVATPMIEVMRYEAKGVVATADDPDAFSDLLREMAALSADPLAREERLRIAHENSWQARFQQILEYVPELRGS